MPKKPDVFRINESNKNSSWGWKCFKDYKDGTKPVRKLITQRADGTPYKTKKEAEDARDAFIQAENIRRGLGGDTEATLSAVYNAYTESETWKSLALGTQRRYDSSWRIHIQEDLGELKISTISAFQLREHLLKKYNSGVTYSNLESIFKVLSIIYRYAANSGIISLKLYKEMFKDDSTLKIMPEKMRGEKEKTPVTFNDVQLYKIEKYLRDSNSPFLTIYMLARYAGLRRSECIGLRWSDINFKSGTLIPKFQMLYDDKEKVNYLTPVKTHKGYAREIIMCPVLQQYLSEQYRKQKEQRKSKVYQNTEKVLLKTVDEKTHKKIENVIIGGDFVNRRSNGALIIPGSLRRMAEDINKILDEDKRPFKLHNLRHDFATRCATNGVSSLKLCAMMGHEKYETTMNYYINSANSELDRITREQFTKIFEPKEPEIIISETTNELNTLLDNLPLPEPVTDEKIQTSAKKLNVFYSKLESVMPSIRVVHQEIVVHNDEMKIVRQVFEDGHETVVDMSGITE